MKIDMTGVKGPGPVDSGVYPVVITKAEEAVVKEGARNAGEPLLKLEFTITDDEEFIRDNNLDRDPCEGKKVWDNMVITAGDPDQNRHDTRWRAQMLLKALGKDVPKGEIEFDAEEEILGKEVVIEVLYVEGSEKKDTPGEFYNDRNQVKSIRSKDAPIPSLR